LSAVALPVTANVAALSRSDPAALKETLLIVPVPAAPTVAA
jgi:hypothetical protein